jgi:hypothetical protein
MFKKLVLLFAAAIAVGRIFIAPRLVNIPSAEGSYEAFAHILVGFLIIVPFYDRKAALGPSKLFGWIGWGLAIWEGVWFAVQKHAA